MGVERTRIEVVLIGTVVDENAGFRKGSEHLHEEVLLNVRSDGELVERVCVVVVVLQQHCRLVCVRRNDVFLVEIIGPQLISGIIPKPHELPAWVHRMVIALEAAIG